MMITNVSSPTLLSSSTPRRLDTSTPSSSRVQGDGDVSASAVSASGMATSDGNKEQLTPTKASSVTQVQSTDIITNDSSESDVQSELITQELAERDREVKTHEQIHASIGGAYASAPSFSYERGPDGQLYAVEGEVRIDTSPVADDPRATLEKAEVILRASLSVAEPSAADRQVAADARVMAAEARAELLKVDSGQPKEQVSSSTPVNDEVKPQSVDDQEDIIKDDEDIADALNEFQAKQNETQQAVADQMQAFNERLNDINMAMRKVNAMLVDTGAFAKLFPEGSVIDKSV